MADNFIRAGVVAAEIVSERHRQIQREGWDPGHDDEHRQGELAKVAAALAVHGTDATVMDPNGYGSADDPWGLIVKHGRDYRRSLIIAGALIIAEIERHDRAESRQVLG